ncbi:MAG TPA: dihydroxyacetone kinase phosphoryl donor subunit DhaM, partial [Actinomycetota bacterium]|nr:dihydroxyacetone kinase phosphoryl donor subunit DhaM [Actinomycetota bacterium]
MVGIVIVSHSHLIAEGVAALAREMGGADVKLETAGGLEAVDGPGGPEHPIGTDAVLVMQAIDRAWSDDGVLVLMDLGSAVLSAEMALDLLGDDRRDRIVLSEAPLVEGAVAAAVTAKLGLPIDAVAREARSGHAAKATHLGAEDGPESRGSTSGSEGNVTTVPRSTEDVTTVPGSTEELVAVLAVDVPHGLHARPAARFVQTAAGFDAAVRVRNLTTGAGPADAASLNGVATLGVRAGHEVEIRASGPEAAGAIDALRALAARHFDEPDEPEPPRTPPGSARGGGGEPTPAPGAVLRGYAASPGIAVGPSRRFHTPALDVPEGEGKEPAIELAALGSALRETADTIAGQRDAVAARAGEGEARIFDAHLLFLRDEALLGPARAAIGDDGLTAARAWRDAVDAMAATWASLEDEYMQARAVDLRSVGDQVLARIIDAPVPAPRLEAPGILVAADLTPADTAGLDPEIVRGIATAHGGPTSHAAVLARALGMPAVVGIGPRLLELA